MMHIRSWIWVESQNPCQKVKGEGLILGEREVAKIENDEIQKGKARKRAEIVGIWARERKC